MSATVATPRGRNFVSEYASNRLPDDERCTWRKGYRTLVCNDPATLEATWGADAGPLVGKRYGYCAYHGPLQVARAAKEIGATVTLKPRS